jgi:hypothetical protein
MGMSNWILDQVEKFWSLAHTVIGECETAEEWKFRMKAHEHLLLGHEDLEFVQEPGYYEEAWNDYWSDKV